jgi:hypothetical protein
MRNAEASSDSPVTIPILGSAGLVIRRTRSVMPAFRLEPGPQTAIPSRGARKEDSAV